MYIKKKGSNEFISYDYTIAMGGVTEYGFTVVPVIEHATEWTEEDANDFLSLHRDMEVYTGIVAIKTDQAFEGSFRPVKVKQPKDISKNRQIVEGKAVARTGKVPAKKVAAKKIAKK